MKFGGQLHLQFTSSAMSQVLANKFRIRKTEWASKANSVSVGQTFFLKPPPIDSAQPPISSDGGNRAMVVAKKNGD